MASSESVSCLFLVLDPAVPDSGFAGIPLRKKVMKEKGEVYALFSDIYRGEKQTITTDYANQYNSFRAYGDSQSFRLGFRYNFGSQKLENKAREVQTEEQKRL